MELAVSSVPPITATSLRLLIAAPLIMLLTRYKRLPILFPADKRLEFVLITLFYFALPFTLMIFGEQYISSGLASIIFATMPIAILSLGAVLHGHRVAFHQLVGLAIALISLIEIINIELGIAGGQNIIGVIALVVAVLMHASIYVNMEKRCANINVLTYNGLPCLTAAVLLLLAGVFIEQPNIANFSLQSLGAISYLGVVAGIGGIMAYFQLNKMASPFQASLCFLIFPVIALSLDALVNGRNLSEASLLLIGTLLIGVLLTKIPKQKMQQLLKRST